VPPLQLPDDVRFHADWRGAAELPDELPRFQRDGAAARGSSGAVSVSTGRAFGGASGQRADVWTAAISETEIYSVQGQFGKTPGVKKNTSPSGGTSSTVPGSTSILPPLRIGVIRR
jgi:hypothetical protein